MRLPGLAPAGDSLYCSCNKVSKQARPAAPASLRSAALAAKGLPGRCLNSLRSNNGIRLPPANLPHSAAQKGIYPCYLDRHAIQIPIRKENQPDPLSLYVSSLQGLLTIMFDALIEVIAWFMVEVVFYTILYAIGWGMLKAVTFGHYPPPRSEITMKNLLRYCRSQPFLLD
jgi:hypothetical protein